MSRGMPVVSGLNGWRLILGTVIDTYMEEAQEELRSKRVKQSKGWDSMPTAFGTARLSTQMWQVSCGPFPCWTFETKEWPPVELHRKMSCAGTIKTLLRSADDGWFSSYVFCIFLPFSFKLVRTHAGKLRQKAFERLLQKLRPSDSPFERHLKFSHLDVRSWKGG